MKQVCIGLLAVVATIAVGLGNFSSALAADAYNYQNNQELNQSATLTASNSDRPINFYPQPDLRKPPLGKAQTGARVTVLQQISGNRGKQWDYVKFENEKQSEGWIQQDFIAIQTQQTSQQVQKPDRQSQSQSTAAYSQQEDYPDSQQSNKYQTNQKQAYSQEKQEQQKSQSYRRNQ